GETDTTIKLAHKKAEAEAVEVSVEKEIKIAGEQEQVIVEEVREESPVKIRRKKKVTDEGDVETTVKIASRKEQIKASTIEVSVEREIEIEEEHVFEETEEESPVKIRRRKRKTDEGEAEESFRRRQMMEEVEGTVVDVSIESDQETSYTHVFDEQELLVIDVDDQQLVEESKRIRPSKRLSVRSEGDEYYEEYIVKSKYTATKSTELSVNRDETVWLIEKQSSEYWYVRRQVDREEGLVPKSILIESSKYMKSDFEGELIAPKFVEKARDQYIREGESFTFAYKLIGNPRPQVTWYKQSNFLMSTENVKIIYENDTCSLTFKRAYFEDSGTYSIVAKNIAGFAASTAELIVESKSTLRGNTHRTTR
ncbi:Titin-like protein, partial [Leptotrombidium deliense]